MSEPDSQDAASDAPVNSGPPAPPPDPAGRWTAWHLAAVGAAACAGALVTLWLLAAHPSARDETGSRVSLPPKPAAALPAPSRPDGVATGWSDRDAVRWTGGHHRSVAYELPAGNVVTVWMKRVRPVLVVRCLSNRTDAFVFTDSPASIEPDPEARTVRVRIDDGEQATEHWVASAGHDGLFAPDGADFARRLAGARRLEFGFTPQNAVPVVATFDLRGADAIFRRVSAACVLR
jgi:hypothetical protein